MRYYLTKASSDDWYNILEIQNEDNIETLYDKFGSIIIKHNDWYGEDIEDICHYCRVPKEDAKKISETRIEIMIYDDYIS